MKRSVDAQVRPRGFSWRVGVVVLLAALCLYVVVPQLSTFGGSTEAIKRADIGFVLLAFLCVMATYMCAAILYMLLAFRALRLWPTFVVQMAGAFVNRALPAGIGGIGLSAYYLYRQKHAAPVAGAVVAVNNAIGAVAHVLLLCTVVLVFGWQGFRVGAVPWAEVGMGLIALAILLGVGFVLRGSKVGRAMRKNFGAFAGAMSRYRKRPRRLAGSLLVAAALTSCNIVALWAAAASLDVHLTLVAACMVFSFGIVIGTVTPTPGGLGGAEAALVGALVVIGIAAPQALAVALLFRVISYWVPMVFGVGALLLARRCRYI